MRPTDHLSWQPEPNAHYYAHVAMPADSSACGLVLARVEHGRSPCFGANAGIKGWPGDVLFDARDQPAAAVTVRYEPLVQTKPPSEFKTKTDGKGRHQLWIPPGRYRYQYVVEVGGAILGPMKVWNEVEVKPGHQIIWESAKIDANGEVSYEMKQRDASSVIEELVLDWNRGDGEPFQWAEVVDTIAEVCKKCRVRQLSFARPAKADFVTLMQMRGVPCIDTNWRDVEYGTAFRNFRAFNDYGASSGFFWLSKNKDLRNQTTYLSIGENKRLHARAGVMVYLAEARIGAIHFAVQSAALSGTGRGAIRSVGQVLAGSGGDMGPMSLEQALGVFGLDGR